MAADNEFQKPKAVNPSGAPFQFPALNVSGVSRYPGVAREMVDLHLQGRKPQRLQTSSSIHAKIRRDDEKNIWFSGVEKLDSGSSLPRPNMESTMQNSLISDRSRGTNQGQSCEREDKGSDKPLENFGCTPKTGDLLGYVGPFATSANVSPNISSNISNISKISSVSPSFPWNLPKYTYENKSQVSVPAKSHVGPCKNPSCHHCGTVIIPSPKATYPLREQPSITVNDWSIYTTKGPICSSDELDHLNNTRFEFPLPEMIFGSNRVLLVNEKTGASIEFNTLDALDSLASTADFKVAYYREWLSTRPKAKASNDEASEGRKDASSSTKKGRSVGSKSTPTSRTTNASDETPSHSPDLQSVKPYDWTYSTNYKGTLSQCSFTPTSQGIPLEKLVRQDPILFYDECVLFEDELGDNGISMFSTKIRVMHSCLLLLCRFSMRVDDVAFRIRDTRVYIDLESNLVLREYKVQQASYAELLGIVTGRSSDPKKILRDSNWVSQNTPVLSREVEIMQSQAA